LHNELVNYTYDAANNRISLTSDTGTTSFVYDTSKDQSHLLVRTDANGKSTYYVYGKDLISEESENGYKVYHYDLRGSTVALTSQSGKVTDRYTYSTYGEMASHTGSSDTPFLYDGRDGVMTDENGLF
jgi:YD repeat-containing protein